MFHLFSLPLINISLVAGIGYFIYHISQCGETVWITTLCAVLLGCIYMYICQLELKGLHKRYVFITGCDTGFGNLLARTLDCKGVPVIAGCLTQAGADKLKAETSSSLKTVILDITNEESVEMAFEFVKHNIPSGGLWGLVNNAGIMPTYGPVEWDSTKDFKKTCEVNLFGTISMTLKFLPLLRESRGRLVNVCSVTSNFGYPGVTSYVVSKAGVKMFTACLRRELLRSGVTTHTIEPGGFSTQITDKQRLLDAYKSGYMKADPGTQKFYGGYISRYLIDGIYQTAKFVSTKPTKVSDSMVHALLARYPKRCYLVGYDAHLFFRMLRTVPELVADYIIGWPSPYGEICEELRD